MSTISIITFCVCAATVAIVVAIAAKVSSVHVNVTTIIEKLDKMNK